MEETNQKSVQKREKDRRRSQIEKKQDEKYYRNLKFDFGQLETRYIISKELARGGYGVVYKAYAKTKDGQKDKTHKFAVKIIFGTINPEVVLNEISFLRLIKGKFNTVKLVDAYMIKLNFCLVLEYFKAKPFLEYFEAFTILDVKYYLYQLLKALHYLKKLGIVHRDIKPSNFLFNFEDKKGILIDFGLAELESTFSSKIALSLNSLKSDDNDQIYYQNILKTQGIISQHKLGTEGFMALEVILKYEEQSYETDMWSVGVIFLELLTKKHPFFNTLKFFSNQPKVFTQNPIASFFFQIANIFGTQAVIKQLQKYNIDIKFPAGLPEQPIKWLDIIQFEGFDEVAEDLLNKLLCLDPTKRISVEDALKHSFFHEIQQSENTN